MSRESEMQDMEMLLRISVATGIPRHSMGQTSI